MSVYRTGKNHCQWLVLSSIELCGRSCLGNYCKIHLALLLKGSDMWEGRCQQILIVVVVTFFNNNFVNCKAILCQAHSYENEMVKVWQQRKVAFNHEYERLSR